MKYLIVLISALLFLCGFIGLVISVLKILKAITQFFEIDGHPGLYMVLAIDTILLSTVLFILAGGLYKLFSSNPNTFNNIPMFSNLTFKSLKIMFWETLLLALTVHCTLTFYFIQENEIGYEKLIFPVTILLLALSLKFITKNNT